MANDTILLRLDTPTLTKLLAERPETADQEIEQILERLIAAFQRQLEVEVHELEQGRGRFETCLFEAL